MARKIQEACSEMTMSLRMNFTRSRYGCQTRGPRRFCSLAFQFLMQPLTSGAIASSNSVCKTVAMKFFIPNRGCATGTKSEIRNPKSETNPNDEIRNPERPSWQNFAAFEPSDFELVSDFGFRISDLTS